MYYIFKYTKYFQSDGTSVNPDGKIGLDSGNRRRIGTESILRGSSYTFYIFKIGTIIGVRKARIRIVLVI
jgi:hypothetical protein